MKPIDWDIRRKGRRWSHEEFDQRIYQAPEKIEFVHGIFARERERLSVLGMLLENLGIDKVIRLGIPATSFAFKGTPLPQSAMRSFPTNFGVQQLTFGN
jgi:hypothetical protein